MSKANGDDSSHGGNHDDATPSTQTNTINSRAAWKEEMTIDSVESPVHVMPPGREEPKSLASEIDPTGAELSDMALSASWAEKGIALPQPLPETRLSSSTQQAATRRRPQASVPGAHAVQSVVPWGNSANDLPSQDRDANNPVHIIQEQQQQQHQPQQQEQEDSNGTDNQHRLPENQVPSVVLPNQRSKQNWCRSLLWAVSLKANLVLLAVIVVLAVFLTTTSKRGGDRSSNKNNPSLPTAIPMHIAPNESEATPSLAPTTVLDSLNTNLPEYTLVALEDPRSPQSKAYEWVIHNLLQNTTDPPDYWRLQQLFVLATFYYSTRGDHWVSNHGWLDWEVNECDWEQPRPLYLSPEPHCNEMGEIQALSFQAANNLDGTIPPEVALLGSLQQLTMFQNSQLKGSLPTEIGLLTSLTHLEFGSTGLSGTFPSEMGQLQLLSSLSLSDSPLSGSFPSEIGAMSKLESLFLARTDQSGSFPSEFYNLQNLKRLTVMGCPGLETESLLQSAVANMPQLERISLSDRSSEAQMPFPSNLGRLTGLSSFGLTNWKINGSIPSEIGQLTKLFVLALDGNSISGTMPSALANLSNLQFLTVGSNRLWGTLPSFLYSHLQSLQVINLKENQFSGTIATEVGLLSSLMMLELQNTNISGTLPTELLLLESLTSMHVANTSFSGSIPVEMCDKMVQQEIKCFGGQCYPVTNTRASCEGTALCECECGPCPAT